MKDQNIGSIVHETTSRLFSMAYDQKEEALVIYMEKVDFIDLFKQINSKISKEILSTTTKEYRFGTWVHHSNTVTGFSGCIQIEDVGTTRMKLVVKYTEETGLCVAKSLENIFRYLRHTNPELKEAKQNYFTSIGIQGMKYSPSGCATRFFISPAFSYWLYTIRNSEEVMRINKIVQDVLVQSYKTVSGENDAEMPNVDPPITKDAKLHLFVPSPTYSAMLFTKDGYNIEKADSLDEVSHGQITVCHNMDLYTQSLCVLAGFAKLCEIFERST
ncbi:hypothetical protein KC852_01630 [Candidatus Nomurabacteria bacterium]|nr:hypothetical protein [Candidatus Nomurabacteria bacterium]